MSYRGSGPIGLPVAATYLLLRRVVPHKFENTPFVHILDYEMEGGFRRAAFHSCRRLCHVLTQTFQSATIAISARATGCQLYPECPRYYEAGVPLYKRDILW